MCRPCNSRGRVPKKVERILGQMPFSQGRAIHRNQVVIARALSRLLKEGEQSRGEAQHQYTKLFSPCLAVRWHHFIAAGGAPWPAGASGPGDHLRKVFYRMGFNDQEIVALSGMILPPTMFSASSCNVSLDPPLFVIKT